ncbi:Alpha/beta-hydrolase [Fusarium keratoplasticum]|nr:Alpha/beta-hydrolase [Fusarium keratoplasticum]
MSSTTENLKLQFPDLEWQKLPDPKHHQAYVYHGFMPEKTTIKKGHMRPPGRRPFLSDTIYERDVGIPLRNVVILYADVFRPVESDHPHKVPAILPWSPYGKTGTGTQQYESLAPFRAGLRLDQTSGYDKFQGPDPADCLAISQINFASRLAHPALKALAPWESRNDLYRDTLARGGKKHNPALHKFLLAGFAGPNTVENMPTLLPKHPLYDEYWASKYIHTENITVPMYVVASYSSQLHSRGAFHAFRTAKSAQKWLRVHPHQEWYGLNRPEMVDDLQRYFDRYLKGIDNGWEKDTPRVRLSLLGFEVSGGISSTIRVRPEPEWPLSRQQLRRLYLDVSTMSLQEQHVGTESSVSYAANDMYASSDFTVYFDKYTEIAGYAKVCLWMSCEDHDDLDVAVQIPKYLGPQVFLRASHSVTKDDTLSSEQEIFYRHDRRRLFVPGSIVRLEITLWPMGMTFETGEGIMLRVAGHDMCLPETDRIKGASANNENIGDHKIYAGGEYQSYLVLPVV